MRRAAVLLLLAALPAAASPGARPDSARARRDTLALFYTVVPYFLYSPETRWGGGAAGGFFKRLHPEARPTSLLAQAMYTQRNQYQVGIHADHHAPGNRASAWVDLSFREFPDRFYGVGPDTPDSLEESYTARSFLLAGQGMRAVRGPLKAGLLGVAIGYDLVEAEAGGLLARGRVPGAGAWTLAGFGPQLAWDTRDAVFFPRSGSFVELGHAWYPLWTGGDAGAQQLKLNARKYLGFGARQALAFQGGFDFAWGDLPFAYLPALGGANVMRGYYQGRHRDKAMAAAQAEYRFPVWKRLGGAAFAGLGKVGADPLELAGERLRASGGAGLRVRLNREGVNLRCDLAFDREAESSLYVTFMEAF